MTANKHFVRQELYSRWDVRLRDWTSRLHWSVTWCTSDCDIRYSTATVYFTQRLTPFCRMISPASFTPLSAFLTSNFAKPFAGITSTCCKPATRLDRSAASIPHATLVRYATNSSICCYYTATGITAGFKSPACCPHLQHSLGGATGHSAIFCCEVGLIVVERCYRVR